MKIAITGATGQLGRLVVNKLKEKLPADHIVALVRSAEKAAGLGVEAREADYDKPETLDSALGGVDTLLLISGSEVGQRKLQHRNVIDAAKKAGVKWIVYTSLLRADKSSLSLAAEHLETEAALKQSGIPFTLLRNGWYTENYTGSISSAARVDFAEAAVAVLTGDGHQDKIYELAGDEAYTLSDLAAEVSKQTGKNIPYKNLPEADYAAALTSFGLPEGLAHAIAGYDVSASRGDLFDEGRQLSRLIGRPTTPLSVQVANALQASANG
jgi:NAD(P)H dehydrogenase (quinone)